MQIRLMDISDYDYVYRLWMATPGMGLNDVNDSRDGIVTRRGHNEGGAGGIRSQ